MKKPRKISNDNFNEVCKYNAYFESWELYFEEQYGVENREKIVKAFVDFWNNPVEKYFYVPGKCKLGGKLLGRSKYYDREDIILSDIISIERISNNNVKCVPHDLLCATSETGGKYRFYSNEHNPYMFLMLGDMLHTGRLSRKPDAYIRRGLRCPEFI